MNWLDIIIILILAGGLVSGYKNGFVGEVASLAGLVLGIWGAIKFSWWTADLLERFGLTFSLMPIISFIVTFLIITIIMQIIAGIISKLLEAISLNWINKIAGIIAGVFKAAIFVSVILLVLEAVSERHPIIPETIRSKSLLYEPVSEIVPTLLPFLKLEELAKARKAEDMPSKES
ncbi:MAG: CvpA family protein [Porphyromonadaceae bacterium]|nr:MAG: CvpA family protein [Porphyromonadaceae bacterium]